ncbi:MAG: translation initiation factor IF-2 subunit gamma [Nitrososphaerota archaeon]|nr:translation initiation factor IF-2 subunit gamma [Nitrososphaerota archaeon]
MIKALPRQPEVNIGTLGHVDNGKSTLIQAITGIWTAKHSEELKRGITIRIGYADAAIYECEACDEPFNFKAQEVCTVHNRPTVFRRAISFIDCPGHHSLMITMLSGASLFDGAIFVIDGRREFPQSQDREHLEAANIMGISSLIFVQNKIDLISRESAIQNYEDIKRYLSRGPFKDSAIIPVSAQQRVGIEPLLYGIQRYITTPSRDVSRPFLMPILRSFDVNLPGTLASKISGGVIGGSIIRGQVSVGDPIEIRPGLPEKENVPRSKYESVYTTVKSIKSGNLEVKRAVSGGLIGIETELDPSLTRSDALSGNMAGKPDALPPTHYNLQLEYQLFKKVVGVEGDIEVKQVAEKEQLVVNAYSSVTVGVVTKRTSDELTLDLTKPICAPAGHKVTISRRIGTSWRLIGFGIIKG